MSGVLREGLCLDGQQRPGELERLSFRQCVASANTQGLTRNARIFISYRREDGSGFAGQLAEDLERRFGANEVFRDVEDIAP